MYDRISRVECMVDYHIIMPNTLDNSVPIEIRKCTLADPHPTVVIFFHIAQYKVLSHTPSGQTSYRATPK